MGPMIEFPKNVPGRWTRVALKRLLDPWMRPQTGFWRFQAPSCQPLKRSLARFRRGRPYDYFWPQGVRSGGAILWLVGVGCSKILLRFGTRGRGQSRALRRAYLNPLMRHDGPAPVAVPLDHEVAMSGARAADDHALKVRYATTDARINLVSAHTHAKRKAFRQRRFRWSLVLHRTASLILRRRAKQAAGQSGHQNARKPRSSRKSPASRSRPTPRPQILNAPRSRSPRQTIALGQIGSFFERS